MHEPQSGPASPSRVAVLLAVLLLVSVGFGGLSIYSMNDRIRSLVDQRRHDRTTHEERIARYETSIEAGRVKFAELEARIAQLEANAEGIAALEPSTEELAALDTNAEELVALKFQSGLILSDPRTFHITRVRVTFQSEALLETIHGLCDRGSGDIHFDPFAGGTRGSIIVPADCFDTGIEERNEHLRGVEWLDADVFPNASFEIESVRGASSLVAQLDRRFRVYGRFTLHGQTQDVAAEARVKWDGANTLQMRARLDIALSDFDIYIPSAVQTKVSNVIRIVVRLRADV